MQAASRHFRPVVLGIVLSLACGAVAPSALAWSDHASLLWPLVRMRPELRDSAVTAETLAAFVTAEAAGLARRLAEHEAQAREALPHYPPRPDALAFDASANAPAVAFLEAIRVNPTLSYSLFVRLLAEDTPPAGAALLRFSDLSFLSGGGTESDARFLAIEPGTAVSPAHILATANDEPDFGMDIGLYTDNDSEFGRRYGFGSQPFGNPNLEYSSQAPFHMGFYHLDWLTRLAQPDLLRTLPEWRVSLFGALSQFAFERGHPYWGWRFAGWALHYIGDLSQPYHAEPLPGVSTLRALWLVITGETTNAIQLVSNRHGVIESYQYQRVKNAQAAGRWQDPILNAIAAGAPVPVFTDQTVRQYLSRDSVHAGAALDAALVARVPARFVSDPGFEWVGSGEEEAIVSTVRREGGETAVVALDGAVARQMLRFSRFAQAWIERSLQVSQN